MKSFSLVFIILIALLLSGCPARSFYPLFTEHDAIFNPSLIGTWQTTDATYSFEKTEGKQYKLMICSLPENDTAMYAVSSGKIGTSWYLDSYPVAQSQEHHFLSMHLITKMTLSGDTLTLATLEADWLSKMMAKKKRTVTHVQREDEIILTASTGELQKFIASIGNNTDAFPDPDTLIRMR